MSENIIALTMDNFDDVTASKEKVVLVDFWAQWCGPCRAITPVLEKLASEYPDRLVVGKVNVDEQGDLAIKYGITGIPALKLFKGGKITENLVGLQPYQTLKNAIERNL